MKKIIFALALLSFTFSFAQENEQAVEKKNELHFNALLPIAFKTVEVSYERILNEESSVGITALYGNEEYYFQKYSISPYYRKFFSNGNAKGFFLEGFLMVNGGSESDYYYEGGYYYDYENDYTDLAFGIGLGVKFLTEDNFVGLINLGIARNLGNESPEVIGKGGISIGYRF